MKKNKSLHSTSWTDKELFKLSNRSNHKIVKLSSGDFQWNHNINGTWENHYLETFENRNKPLSFLHFSLAKWREELELRQKQQQESIQRAWSKLQRIKDSNKKSNVDKIREIKKLDLNLTNEELANELGVSRQTIYRASRQPNTLKKVRVRTRRKKPLDNSKSYNTFVGLEIRTQSEEYKNYVAKFNMEIEEKHKEFIKAKDIRMYDFIDKLVNDCDLCLAS